jgi:hypothetical protein
MEWGENRTDPKMDRSLAWSYVLSSVALQAYKLGDLSYQLQNKGKIPDQSFIPTVAHIPIFICFRHAYRVVDLVCSTYLNE